MNKSPHLLLIKSMKNSIFYLPTPINISYMWNLGSMLGLFLMIQIISGLFLSMHYCPNIYHAFKSIIFIIQDINYGWLMHNIHINGASLFFICLYLHIARGIYYNSFKFLFTWMSGVSIFIISMTIAFLGYILPWGQMSFWGATVITNLISTIPYLGTFMVQWIWGGYSINNATLNRFYSIHFILPFILIIFIFMHLFFLHITGSSNPLGTPSDLNKIFFHDYFSYKDLFGFMIFLMLLFYLILQTPYMLSDPENFMEANPMITPTHIQPEWYFLFAYAILRSIPNKLGGVLALLFSLLILYILPLMNSMKFNSFYFYPINQLTFWFFINIFILLTWLGAQPIEPPFILLSQIMSLFYFFFFLSFNFLSNLWDNILFNFT